MQQSIHPSSVSPVSKLVQLTPSSSKPFPTLFRCHTYNRITCPNAGQITLNAGENAADVRYKLPMPKITDNIQSDMDSATAIKIQRWPASNPETPETLVTQTLVTDTGETVHSVDEYTFPLGKTRVIYTASDKSFNSASCAVYVTVQDKFPPMLAGCSSESSQAAHTLFARVATDQVLVPLASLNVSLDLIDAEQIPFWGKSGYFAVHMKASDNVPTLDGLAVTMQLDSEVAGYSRSIEAASFGNTEVGCTMTPAGGGATGDCSGISIPMGAALLTFNAVDQAGNSGRCSVELEVVDTQAPDIDCVKNYSYEMKSYELVGQRLLPALATLRLDPALFVDPSTSKDNSCISDANPIASGCLSLLSLETTEFEIDVPVRILVKAADQAGNTAACSTRVTITLPPTASTTHSSTPTSSATATFTTSLTTTASSTATDTATSATTTVTSTQSISATSTQSSSATSTASSTGVSTHTSTRTSSLTSTPTSTQTSTMWSTVTSTAISTVTTTAASTVTTTGLSTSATSTTSTPTTTAVTTPAMTPTTSVTSTTTTTATRTPTTVNNMTEVDGAMSGHEVSVHYLPVGAGFFAVIFIAIIIFALHKRANSVLPPQLKLDANTDLVTMRSRTNDATIVYRWGAPPPAQPDMALADFDEGVYQHDQQGIPIRQEGSVGVPSKLFAVAHKKGMLSSRHVLLEVPSRQVMPPIVHYVHGQVVITPESKKCMIYYQFTEEHAQNNRHQWQSKFSELDTGAVSLTVDADRACSMVLLAYAARPGYHKSEVVTLPITIEQAPLPNVIFNASKGTVRLQTHLEAGRLAYNYTSSAGMQYTGEVEGPEYVINLGRGANPEWCAVTAAAFGAGFAPSKAVTWQPPDEWIGPSEGGGSLPVTSDGNYGQGAAEPQDGQQHTAMEVEVPQKRSKNDSKPAAEPENDQHGAVAMEAPDKKSTKADHNNGSKSNAELVKSRTLVYAVGNDVATVIVHVPTGEKLGLRVVNAHEKVYIEGCAPGGNADRTEQIRAGDRLVRVNDIDVSRLSKQECTRILLAAAKASTSVSLALVQGNASAVSYPVSPAPAAVTHAERLAEMSPLTVKVRVPKGSSIGVSIIHDDDGFNYIQGTTPDSNADGKLLQFDRLVKVGTTDVSTLSKEACVSVLRKAAGTSRSIAFAIMRRNNASTAPLAGNTKKKRFEGMQTRRGLQPAGTHTRGGDGTAMNTLDAIAFGSIVARPANPPAELAAAPAVTTEANNDPEASPKPETAQPPLETKKKRRAPGALGKVTAMIDVPEGEGLGIGVRHENGANYVSGMKPGGNAESCGLIEVEDKFLFVNQTNVTTFSREKCIAALKAAAAESPTKVKLVFRRKKKDAQPALASSVLDSIAYGNLPAMQTRSKKAAAAQTPPPQDADPTINSIYGAEEDGEC